jgi:dTDP-4-amino-4,6-dideoxy-D-galactose acyltransferase
MEKLVQYLVWDSDFFGYKIGELRAFSNLDNHLQEAKNEGYKLIYAKSQDIKTHDDYIKAGGKLVDEKITFSRSVPQIQIPQPINIKLYEQQTVSKNLLDLAIQSGIYSRFKLDTNFKNHEFEKLYTAWIENSVKKQIAEYVIISEIQGKIVGLLTLGIKNDRADIGILSVDERFRGHGIATQLMNKAFLESEKLLQTRIQVVTQKANKQACSFYKKLGFEIEKTENIYHFWL